MIKYISSESLKLKRSAFYKIHFFLPVLSVLVMAGYILLSGGVKPGSILLTGDGYMMLSNAAGEKVLVSFFTLLAVALPTAVSLVCGKMTEMEMKAGNMQFMLAAARRSKLLLTKVILLLLWGAAAILFAALLFEGAVYLLFGSGAAAGPGLIIKSFLMLWLSVIPLYMLHLLLGFAFGEGISIGIGIGESLIAALLYTGLGDGRWYFVPASYGIRFINMQFLEGDFVHREFLMGGVCGGIITILLTFILFIWFKRFEGRQRSRA